VRFPSIRNTVRDAQHTLSRFPFVILDAMVCTVAALILIDHTGPPRPTILFPILLATLLGIPLLVAFALMAEKRKWNLKQSLAAQIICLLLVAAYAFSVPEDFANAPGIHLFRFFVLAIGCHLLVAVNPFFRRGTVNGFWHLNMKLFLRILTSVVYALVLYGGLAIALAALDKLFGVSIPGKRYTELWILLNGTFCTWFFLAGVPEDLDGLDSIDDYPKGLKIFAQYILIPLVIVYLIILYAYMGKIVVTWDWPQGWVSKLILGFAGTGIFTLLLLHPISGKTENVWIKTISRWFYTIVAPLVFMLFLAVWRRVAQYGFTEERYLAIASGIWLAVVIFYNFLSKQKSIKFIPASLCVAIFFASVGPWSAFAISETSQVGRLRVLLLKDSVLLNGTIQSVHSVVSFEDSRQISSVIEYLHDMHGYDKIRPWFAESLRKNSSANGLAIKGPEEVTKSMGIDYVAWRQYGIGGYMSLTADRERFIGIEDYDRMARILRVMPGQTGKRYADLGLTIRSDDRLNVITLSFGDKNQPEETFRIGVGQLVDRILRDSANSNFSQIPPENMCVTGQIGHRKIKVFIPEMFIEKQGSSGRPVWCDLDLFYSNGALK
jgi:hypothetical protein